jgi:hypothetical protein
LKSERPWYLKDIKGCIIELNGEVYKIISRTLISIQVVKKNKNGSWGEKKLHLVGIAHSKFLGRE